MDSAFLLLASWEPFSEALFGQFVSIACANKEVMVIRLGDDDTFALPDSCAEEITYSKDINVFLSRHQVLRLPALVQITQEGVSTIEDGGGADVASGSCAAGNSDDLFARAMGAYEAFDIGTSAKLFAEVLVADPSRQSACFNMAGIMHMFGYPTLALRYIEQFLLLDPADSTARSFLWSLASSDEGKAAGIEVYRRLLSAAGDPVSRHRLAQLTGESCLEADNEYLKEFYDRIADNFEEKLVVHLGYRGPWILFDMISLVMNSSDTKNSLSPVGKFRIFDLGCGSGLCGRVFGRFCVSPLEPDAAGFGRLALNPSASIEATLQSLQATSESRVEPTIGSRGIIVPIESFREAIPSAGVLMAGIDISQKMVTVSAKPLNNYSLLTCGHLSEGLSAFVGDVEKLDLVIAADTFIYVGALGKVFKLISQVLKPNGLLAFSTEILNSANGGDGSEESDAREVVVDDNGEIITESNALSGFKLLESARFGHESRYIHQLCRAYGFKVARKEEHMLRTESSLPLPGLFYVLQKVEV